jgi:hypothetical protein
MVRSSGPLEGMSHEPCRCFVAEIDRLSEMFAGTCRRLRLTFFRIAAGDRGKRRSFHPHEAMGAAYWFPAHGPECGAGAPPRGYGTDPHVVRIASSRRAVLSSLHPSQGHTGRRYRGCHTSILCLCSRQDARSSIVKMSKRSEHSMSPSLRNFLSKTFTRGLVLQIISPTSPD